MAGVEAARLVHPQVTLAGERLLPVTPALQPLLPRSGLQRGTTVSVTGSGATSLALALTASASRAGSWLVAVGLESLGLAAAAEGGLALERVVTVSTPRASEWSTVVAALVDGFDLVLVSPRHRVKLGDARRLVARARERGAVLLPVGGRAWPEATDVSLEVATSGWQGLGQGHGSLQTRRLTVRVGGRRRASQPRQVELWLPGADANVAQVDGNVVPFEVLQRAG